jgi:hypothetical protein
MYGRGGRREGGGFSLFALQGVILDPTGTRTGTRTGTLLHLDTHGRLRVCCTTAPVNN